MPPSPPPSSTDSSIIARPSPSRAKATACRTRPEPEGNLLGGPIGNFHAGVHIKGVDLRVRPINHRLEDRVRAHILLCTLAYYVEWHMRQALVPLLYADEDLEGLRGARETPAAKARPAPAVRLKRAARKSEDSPSLRRRDGLISALSTLARNTCRAGEGKTAVRFTRNTAPGAYRLRVFELLKCDGPAWLVKCAQ